MENLTEQGRVARLHRYTLCALCLLSLSSQTAVAQVYTWQLINQPKINYLSAGGVHPSDANRVLLSAEHDGNWSYSSADGVLRWTFGSPLSLYYAGEEYFHVHSTRYLAAPGVPQHLYMLDLHGGLYYFDGLTWPAFTGPRVDPNNNEDGWYSLAIDPNDNNANGPQRMLAGGPGLIKYYLPSNNTWTPAALNLPPLSPPPFITDIQYVPGDPSSSYVWAAMSEAAGWDDNPSDLLAGVGPGTCYGVLRSTDAGHNWLPYQISTSPGGSPAADCVYAVAPLDSTHVYAATKAGLWRGTYAAGSVSWVEIVPPQVGRATRISSIFYPYVASPSTLYIGLSTANTALNMILKTTGHLRAAVPESWLPRTAPS